MMRVCRPRWGAASRVKGHGTVGANTAKPTVKSQARKNAVVAVLRGPSPVEWLSLRHEVSALQSWQQTQAREWHEFRTRFAALHDDVARVDRSSENRHYLLEMTQRDVSNYTGELRTLRRELQQLRSEALPRFDSAALRADVAKLQDALDFRDPASEVAALVSRTFLACRNALESAKSENVSDLSAATVVSHAPHSSLIRNADTGRVDELWLKSNRDQQPLQPFTCPLQDERRINHAHTTDDVCKKTWASENGLRDHIVKHHGIASSKIHFRTKPSWAKVFSTAANEGLLVLVSSGAFHQPVGAVAQESFLATHARTIVAARCFARVPQEAQAVVRAYAGSPSGVCLLPGLEKARLPRMKLDAGAKAHIIAAVKDTDQSDAHVALLNQIFPLLQPTANKIE